VAAGQLVGLAQIAQAEDAARRQAMLGTLQSINQRGTARENAAAERSRYQTQADIQRSQLAQQASEGKENRLARSSEVDRTIAGNKDIAKIDAEARSGQNLRTRQDLDEKEDYEFVLSQVESENPPTDDEFNVLSARLRPDRATRLDSIRKQTISALHQAADNADAFATYWNGRIDRIGKDPGQTLETLVAEATKSQAGKFIIFDPGLGRFRSVISRPRQPKAGAVAGAPPLRTINDLMNRTPEVAPGSPFPPWVPAPPPEYMGLPSPPLPLPTVGAPVEAPIGMNWFGQPQRIAVPPAR